MLLLDVASHRLMVVAIFFGSDLFLIGYDEQLYLGGL